MIYRPRCAERSRLVDISESAVLYAVAKHVRDRPTEFHHQLTLHAITHRSFSVFNTCSRERRNNSIPQPAMQLLQCRRDLITTRVAPDTVSHPGPCRTQSVRPFLSYPAICESGRIWPPDMRSYLRERPRRSIAYFSADAVQGVIFKLT